MEMKIKMTFYILFVLSFCLFLTAPAVSAEDESLAINNVSSPENVASDTTTHNENSIVTKDTEGEVPPDQQNHEGKPGILQNEENQKIHTKDNTENNLKEEIPTNQTEQKPCETQPPSQNKIPLMSIEDKLLRETTNSSANSTTNVTTNANINATSNATNPADEKANEEKSGAQVNEVNEEKANEEKAAAQVNEDLQEPNIVFPTNNPNREDEFEKMAKQIKPNKTLDEELAKKIGSDWMEHGDHNNETETPNIVFNE